ncbi:MAG: isocitrate/isopropylmalate dehydrogenase family protein [Acidimicrobiia bacterium]|nr:isocitrate/isopropylmalate dehydrogenase family protein [Acidimicrobiia bacterium]
MTDPGLSPHDAVRSYQVVVIRGDGIGPELIDAAMLVLDAVSRKHGGFELVFSEHEAGAGLFRKEGVSLRLETVAAVKEADALFKAPVGLPDVRNADGTEAGLLGGLRVGLDTYANVRPVRLLPGIDAPIKAEPGSIDYVIVRENTEGLYLSRGKGVGTSEVMTDTMLISRKGTERIARFAFELARSRTGAPEDRRRRVTCVDKANVLSSFAFFRQIFDEVGADYPDIEQEHLYADAAAQALVQDPGHYDVLVMENLLGDILSDLGGATVGGIGLCCSANVGDEHAYFEPIHGSAPTLAGLDQANPISQILTAAMMLEHLGEVAAAESIRRAVDAVLGDGVVVLDASGRPSGGTTAAARAVADAVRTS